MLQAADSKCSSWRRIQVFHLASAAGDLWKVRQYVPQRPREKIFLNIIFLLVCMQMFK